MITLFTLWLSLSISIGIFVKIIDKDVTWFMAIKFMFTWPLMLVVFPYMTVREYIRMKNLDKDDRA